MIKKVIILLLSAIGIINLPVYADEAFPNYRIYTYGQFDDVDENNWYGMNNQGVIKQMYEKGIINGIGNNLFVPEGDMLICEAIKIASTINNIYTDRHYQFEKTETWYSAYSNLFKY